MKKAYLKVVKIGTGGYTLPAKLKSDDGDETIYNGTDGLEFKDGPFLQVRLNGKFYYASNEDFVIK
jgi:hypothetical protein